MIVSLSELKRHLRVDGNEDDDLIVSYAEAVEDQLSNWLGRPVYKSVVDLPGLADPAYISTQIIAPRAFHVCVMTLVARHYDDRSGQGGGSDDAAPPASVRALLAGHRVFADIPDASC